MLVLIFLDVVFPNSKKKSVLSMVVGVVFLALNFSYGNTVRYPYMSRVVADYGETGVRRLISNVPVDQKVGLYTGGNMIMGAELILTKRLLPFEFCRDYHMLGNFRVGELVYVPDCDVKSGPMFIPVSGSEVTDLDYIVVQKARAPAEWELSFEQYHILDSGDYYWLTRKLN